MAVTIDDVLHAVQALRRENAAQEQVVSEVRDRARRTETRLTSYLESVGFGTRVQRPRFDDLSNTIHLPSPGCSMRDILDSIPEDARRRMFKLMVNGEVIGYFSVANQ